MEDILVNIEDRTRREIGDLQAALNREKAVVRDLTDEITQKRQRTQNNKAVASKLKEETRELEKHFLHLKENAETLNKSSSFLDEELNARERSLRQYQVDSNKFMLSLEEEYAKYKEIWTKYRTKYESNPRYQKTMAAKRAREEMRERMEWFEREIASKRREAEHYETTAEDEITNRRNDIIQKLAMSMKQRDECRAKLDKKLADLMKLRQVVTEKRAAAAEKQRLAEQEIRSRNVTTLLQGVSLQPNRAISQPTTVAQPIEDQSSVPRVMQRIPALIQMSPRVSTATPVPKTPMFQRIVNPLTPRSTVMLPSLNFAPRVSQPSNITANQAANQRAGSSGGGGSQLTPRISFGLGAVLKKPVGVGLAAVAVSQSSGQMGTLAPAIHGVTLNLPVRTEVSEVLTPVSNFTFGLNKQASQPQCIPATDKVYLPAVESTVAAPGADVAMQESPPNEMRARSGGSDPYISEDEEYGTAPNTPGNEPMLPALAIREETMVFDREPNPTAQSMFQDVSSPGFMFAPRSMFASATGADQSCDGLSSQSPFLSTFGNMASPANGGSAFRNTDTPVPTGRSSGFSLGFGSVRLNTPSRGDNPFSIFGGGNKGAGDGTASMRTDKEAGACSGGDNNEGGFQFTF